MKDNQFFPDALRLHQEGRLEEAEVIYRRILQDKPDHPGSLHLLGVIRQQQGRHAEALELIGRAVAQVPDKAVYRNNYGAAFFALGRHAEALAEFQRAVVQCPEYADAWANLGMVLGTGAAEETDTPSPPAPLPSTGEGRNAPQDRSPQASETAFRRALQIQPWHSDATIQLAALLGNHGRDEEARKLLEAALAAAPCAEFHTALGNLLLNAGLPEQAAKQYRAAIQLKPGDALVHLSLGSACQELHATEEARKCLAQAAALRSEKPLWRMRAEICAPVVFENAEEIEEYCGRVEGAVEECNPEMPSPPATAQHGAGGVEEVTDRTPHAPREGIHHAERDEYDLADGKKK